MNTNTPELTADDRALYEIFEKARAGSTRPAGTLRGIRAVLDKLRQGGEPVAWLQTVEGADPLVFLHTKGWIPPNVEGSSHQWRPLVYGDAAPQASAPVADTWTTGDDDLDMALNMAGMPGDGALAQMEAVQRLKARLASAPVADEAVLQACSDAVEGEVVGSITVKGRGRSSVSLDASHADLPEGEYVIRAAVAAHVPQQGEA